MLAKPLGDQLIVEKFEAETKSASGLILTTDSSETVYQGRIVSVGQGPLKDNEYQGSVFNPGDHIVFSKTSGFKVKIDDGDYLILKEHDVIGIVHDG